MPRREPFDATVVWRSMTIPSTRATASVSPARMNSAMVSGPCKKGSAEVKMIMHIDAQDGADLINWRTTIERLHAHEHERLICERGTINRKGGRRRSKDITVSTTADDVSHKQCFPDAPLTNAHDVDYS
jgi:hypothetical protein